MSEQLLDVSATAELLGVNERWIRRAVSERRIPFVRVGRLIRFRPCDLQAYVERRLVPAAGDVA